MLDASCNGLSSNGNFSHCICSFSREEKPQSGPNNKIVIGSDLHEGNEIGSMGCTQFRPIDP